MIGRRGECGIGITWYAITDIAIPDNCHPERIRSRRTPTSKSQLAVEKITMATANGLGRGPSTPRLFASEETDSLRMTAVWAGSQV
jgi:hypothetical protein